MEAGQVFAVTYPFVRDTFTLPDFDVEVTLPTWKPGCNSRPVYPDSSELICDAEGQMLLTVVAVVKPGKYPTRVFFTRQFKDPDGKTFGKTNLRITTVNAFQRRAKGWFGEEYTVEPEAK